MPRWQAYIKPGHVWEWQLTLPHGWTVHVQDDSQLYAPRQSTCYKVYVSDPHGKLIYHPEMPTGFAEAKSMALDLGLRMKPAIVIPASCPRCQGRIAHGFNNQYYCVNKACGFWLYV